MLSRLPARPVATVEIRCDNHPLRLPAEFHL